MPVSRCGLLLASLVAIPSLQASNLIVNPDFVTGIAGWSGAGITWDADIGDPAPGSLHLILPGMPVSSTCIPIVGEQRVALSARFRTSGSRASAAAVSFTDPACASGGTLVGEVASVLTQQPPDDAWYAFTHVFAIPVDTLSIRIELTTELADGQESVDSYFDGLVFGPVDNLIAHKSFEACWSPAQTIDGFAALVNSFAEGAKGCIPATENACGGSTCDGMPGCPITLRSVSAAYANTSSLMMRMDVTSGVDPLVMDLVSSGVSCTVTVTDTSKLLTTYNAIFAVTHDGNFGFYTGIPYEVQNTAAYGLSSSDWTLGGTDFRCNKAFGLFSTTQIQDVIAAGVQPTAASTMQQALGKTICPLP